MYRSNIRITVSNSFDHFWAQNWLVNETCKKNHNTECFKSLSSVCVNNGSVKIILFMKSNVTWSCLTYQCLFFGENTSERQKCAPRRLSPLSSIGIGLKSIYWFPGYSNCRILPKTRLNYRIQLIKYSI